MMTKLWERIISCYALRTRTFPTLYGRIRNSDSDMRTFWNCDM